MFQSYEDHTASLSKIHGEIYRVVHICHGNDKRGFVTTVFQVLWLLITTFRGSRTNYYYISVVNIM